MFAPVTSKEFTHYYSKDAAFELHAPTFSHRLWIDTGDDAHLPRKAGATPVKFTLRALPFGAKNYVNDVIQQRGVNSAIGLVVAFSIAKIAPLVGDDGKEIKLAFISEAGFVRLDDAGMAMIAAVDEGELYAELANRAWEGVFGRPLYEKG